MNTPLPMLREGKMQNAEGGAGRGEGGRTERGMQIAERGTGRAMPALSGNVLARAPERADASKARASTLAYGTASSERNVATGRGPWLQPGALDKSNPQPRGLKPRATAGRRPAPGARP